MADGRRSQPQRQEAQSQREKEGNEDQREKHEDRREPARQPESLNLDSRQSGTALKSMGGILVQPGIFLNPCLAPFRWGLIPLRLSPLAKFSTPTLRATSDNSGNSRLRGIYPPFY